MTQSTSRGIGILAAVLGIVMIGSGVSKLVGESHQVAMFAQVGLPSWFLALVGTFEVIGGILLVAPPPVVQAAAYMVSTGERLLARRLAPEERLATFQEMWDNNLRFTRLARTDLGVGVADPFEGYQPVVGEEAITFERPTGTA